MERYELSQAAKDGLSAIMAADGPTTVIDWQRHALARLRRAFAADAACFFVHRPDGASPDQDGVATTERGLEQHNDFNAFMVENLDGDTAGLYESYYGRLDPFARVLSRFGPQLAPLATSGSDLVPLNSGWESSEFYADFMRPRDVHHLLCLRLVDGRRVVGLVSLYRKRRRQGFSPRDLAQAQIFAPAVTTSLERFRTAMEFGWGRRLIAGFESLEKHRGLLLVDGDFRLRASSPGGEAWLAGGSAEGKRRFHQQLVGAIRAVCAERVEGGSAHSVVVRDGHGRLFRLAEVNHRSEPNLHTLSFEPLVPDNVIGQNAKCFGLSRRQEQVASLLVEGLSALEVAEQLCLSVATVNNHIQAIYGRIGVRSRGQFIRAITT